MERQFNQAMSRLYAMRHECRAAAITIVDDAIERAQMFLAGMEEADLGAVWFGRLSPEDLRILEINGPPARHIGMTEQDLCGQPVTIFTSQENADTLRLAAQEAIATGEPVRTVARDRDGRLLNVRLVPTVRNGQREILAYATYAVQRFYQRRDLVLRP